MNQNISNDVRHDWTLDEVVELFKKPFNDLVFDAQTIHRSHFDPNKIQLSTLLSVKTGTCPEDCKYCPQSGRYSTNIEKEKLMQVQQVLDKAKAAKASGATRFCVGAAWRNPPKKDFPYIIQMIKEIKSLGIETCMTLGMLDKGQAEELSDAGLDYYNHNLDTSPEFYDSIISTRSYSDRLQTLSHVRNAGMKVCSGGIVGMGETIRDRAGLLTQLANLPVHPESVPINRLIKIAGTPLENVADLDDIEFIRCIAIARILMPKSHIRLSAGRDTMSEAMQALAFLAGANSIFYGEKLLTASNPETNQDLQLLNKLGMETETLTETQENYQDSLHMLQTTAEMSTEIAGVPFYNAAK